MDNYSVDKLANRIMYNYDRNGDGVVNLKGNRDESYFDEETTTTEGNTIYRNVTRYSNEDLFIKADADQDGKITKDEVKAVLNQYDSNKDGKLSARGFWDWLTGKPEGELDVFNREVPEKARLIAKYPIGQIPQQPNIPNPPYPHV